MTAASGEKLACGWSRTAMGASVPAPGLHPFLTVTGLWKQVDFSDICGPTAGLKSVGCWSPFVKLATSSVLPARTAGSLAVASFCLAFVTPPASDRLRRLRSALIATTAGTLATATARTIREMKTAIQVISVPLLFFFVFVPMTNFLRTGTEPHP